MADSQPVESAQLTSFTLFPNLPKEIRLQVWELAVTLFPRIIEVCQLEDKPVSSHAEEKGEAASESESEEEDGNDEEKFQSQTNDPQESGFELAVNERSENVTPKDASNEISPERTEPDGQQPTEEQPNPADTTPKLGADSTTKDTPALDPGRDSDSDSSSDDDDDNNYAAQVEEEETPPNNNPFYTPTKLPPLFSVNQESRSVVLACYPLSFPIPDLHPATIRYNPSIDTLFFPSWCFEHSILPFEAAVPLEVKHTIRRLAFENHVWYSYSEEGYINGQVKMDEFWNLEELILVGRKPGPAGCGCCHEFDGPEEGVVSFSEEGSMWKKEEGESSLPSEETYSGRRYLGILVAFAWCMERNLEWKQPSVVRFVDLKRNGKLI